MRVWEPTNYLAGLTHIIYRSTQRKVKFKSKLWTQEGRNKKNQEKMQINAYK